MLIVISDLHFIDGTAGEHNIPIDAFKDIFLEQIVSLAKRKKAKEIKLLLLGDIPDLIRSTKWLDVEEDIRPWGEQGLADVKNWTQHKLGQEPTATEEICLNILGKLPQSGEKVSTDSILGRNWDVFEFIRNFQEIVKEAVGDELGKGFPVEVIYIPGNHDRLCNLYPSVRHTLAENLNLTVNQNSVEGDPSGDWYFATTFIDENYGVFARHGHEYDLFNYAGLAGLDDHKASLQVPIGDVIATEFAVALPHKADELLGKEHALVKKFQEIDNVRPIGMLFEWFSAKILDEIDDDQQKKEMSDVFDQVLTDFLNIAYVQQWHTSLSNWDEKLRAHGHEWLANIVSDITIPGHDEVIRLASSSAGRWVIERALQMSNQWPDLKEKILQKLIVALLSSEGFEPDLYSQAAFDESVWRDNNDIRYVVYGHTHVPKVVPLDIKADRKILYINTGTWRERIERTIRLDKTADFVGLKHMTYLVFYRPDEDMGDDEESKKVENSVSFDMWTGYKMKDYVK